MIEQTQAPVQVETETRPRVKTILAVRSCDSGIQGPENLILALADELKSRQIRYVIVNLWDGHPPTVELHLRALERGFESCLISTTWGLNPVAVPRLRNLIRRYQPDVVHTHDVKSEFWALPAARSTGTRLVAFHYGRVVMRSKWIQLQDMASLLTFRFYDRVLANSSAQEQELRQWGVPRGKIAVVPSFVDAAAIQPPTPDERRTAREKLGLGSDRTVLSTTAKLSPNKGHIYMLQALVEICAKTPDVVYLVAGEGDATWHGEGGYREELERRAAALGLSEHVRFLGYYPELKTILHASDLVVSPSLREGMQVSLIEAMAAARPVVATAIGGTVDAVSDGETGLLVPASDPGALAHAVLELLGDRERMRAMGAAARRRVEDQFNRQAVTDLILAYSEEAVSGA